MFNRKLLAVALPVLAVTAVVGSGFSAWYFGSTATKANTNIGVQVEAETTNELGAFTLTKNSGTSVTTDTKLGVLHLDQLSDADLAKTSSDRKDENLGIYFSEGDSAKTLLTDFTVKYSIPGAQYEALNKAGLNFDVEIHVELLKDLFAPNGYLETRLTGTQLTSDFSKDAFIENSGHVDSTTYNVYTFKVNSSALSGNLTNYEKAVTMNFGNLATGHNTLLKYAANKKPTDSKTLGAMKTYYSDVKFENAIKISANVVVNDTHSVK